MNSPVQILGRIKASGLVLIHPYRREYQEFLLLNRAAAYRWILSTKGKTQGKISVHFGPELQAIQAYGIWQEKKHYSKVSVSFLVSCIISRV